MASSSVLAVAAANNFFSIDLYRTLIVGNQQDKNVFFSPFSITAALAMINVGAQGPTKQEIASGLHWDTQLLSDFVQINSAYKDLYSKLQIKYEGDAQDTSAKNRKWNPIFEMSPPPQLNLANRVFLQDGMNIKKPFTDTLQSSFNSTLGKVDFAENANGAKDTINKWVESVTNNKIQDLFGTMESDVRLVLVSAIYFKAEWNKQFSEARTVEKDFFTADGRSVKSKFMHYFSLADFPYTEFPDLKATAISLPYVGSSLQMIVVLPDKKDGLSELEESLTVSIFDPANYDQNFEVDLSLPKFRVEGDYKLTENLKSLGIRRAFNNSADFSGITDSAQLTVSDVVHKSFIDVDEKGTEAAAATGIQVVSVLLPDIPESNKKKFTADHPFLFAIVDSDTKLVLFMGRVGNPSHA